MIWTEKNKVPTFIDRFTFAEARVDARYRQVMASLGLRVDDLKDYFEDLDEIWKQRAKEELKETNEKKNQELTSLKQIVISESCPF